MATQKIKISQSFIKDALKTRSLDPKIQATKYYCPMFLKFRYVDKMETKPSDAMLCGNYFEWHLLGATRSGKEPLIPRKGIRDLRPTKSASRNTMVEYIMDKAPKAVIKGTGKRVDLKPKASSSKDELINYLSEKGCLIPEKYTKALLVELVESLPEDKGEPEITQEDLFAFIQTLPEDLSPGEKTTQELTLDLIVEHAKTILEKIGVDIETGDKQVLIQTDGEIGHLDLVSKDFVKAERMALYDVKYTKTKYDDWRNGWFDVEEKDDPKIQASHYLHLYYEQTGEWVPFYFLVFGEDGWVRILKYEMTKTGYALHLDLISEAKLWLKDFIKTKWKARPEFNRCLKCDFNEVCKYRANLPEIETIVI